MSGHTISIEDVAALLGYPKPVRHRQRVCSECGGRVMEYDDVTSAGSPFDTGVTILACEDCGAEHGRERRPL